MKKAKQQSLNKGEKCKPFEGLISEKCLIKEISSINFKGRGQR